MIPALAIIVANYVIFRCIEIMARPAGHFRSEAARIFVWIIALLTISATVFQTMDILEASLRVSEQQDDLRRLLPGLR